MPDPLDPRAWNRFSYVYGNSVNYTDPSGHFPWDVTIDLASFGWSAYDFYQDPSWGNAGWLALDTVGLLPIVPSLGVARRGLQGMDDAVEVLHSTKFIDRSIHGIKGNIKKADIVDDLSTGTFQSKRIAQAIENGDIGVNILGEEMFEKALAHYDPKNLSIINDIDAFSRGRQIYLRQDNGIFIFRDAVHEGTHTLDYLGKKISLSNRSLVEKRALFYEHFFQLAKERPSDFNNLIDILETVRGY